MPGLNHGWGEVQALQLRGDGREVVAEQLAEEVPVALVYNGLSHAVMMASPLDLADFALGFSLSEGIADKPADIRAVEIVPEAGGLSLQIALAQACFWRLKARRRQLTGRTGCGLCGAEALDTAISPIAHVGDGLRMTAAQLHAGLRQLVSLQPLNWQTGGVHAAALLDASGGLLVREDVGRHNALDKLIGAMHRQAHPGGAVLLTSRASYELVHKAASAGLELVAAISAPTAMAVQLAGEAGITLVGFAREDRMTVYTHPERLA
ncbi:formate dehydrogenase accessory sulfurtransferase FdhD [Chitinimonas viridis]|uniref:Sulfur carrier protein FdhD n=1 Tax=Chitinimonas viridis TaxID=664880 RepID=A0ABT8B590_9NEIS|nr:formate dehydrogenase accessory sulfurtransferase FdhD [Chitinimonas viridis]MDN3576674.1 formate dehydrogenase accessory sulfurtransferase FdhD [Chitinimonas viridis]